jgi:fimbrial isopeptide formation D2 family protein
MKKNRVPIISFLLSVCLLLSAFTPLARAEGAGEQPVFSKDYITSFQLVNQDGEDLSEEQEVEKNSEVHLNFAYKVPDEQFDKITAGIQYYITTIPKEIVTPKVKTIELKNEETGEHFATVHISDDGKVSIEFTDYAIENSVLEGNFYINTYFDAEEIGNGGDKEITFDAIAKTVTVHFKQDDTTSLSKKGELGDGGDVVWTVTVTSGEVALDNAVLTDKIEGKQEYVDNSFTIDPNPYDPDSDLKGLTTPAEAGGTLKYQFPEQIPKGTAYTITYKTHPTTVLGTTLNNTAKLEYGKETGRKTLTAGATVEIDKKLISKDGEFVKDGSAYKKLNGKYLILWTVTVNESKETLNSAVLSDTLPAGLTLVEGDDTYPIKNNDTVIPEGSEEGEYSYTGGEPDKPTEFEYQFPETINEEHTITFYTTVDDERYFEHNHFEIKNTATLTVQNGEKEETSSDEAPVAGSDNTVIQKDSDSTGYDAKTHRIHWKITVNESGRTLKDVVVTDEIQDGQKYVDGTFKISPDSFGTLTAPTAGNDDTLKYEFSGTINQEYVITFDTEATNPAEWADNDPSSYSNAASLTVDGIDAGTDGATQGVDSKVLSKSALDPEYDYVNRIITWKILVNEYGTTLTDAVVSDNIPLGLKYVEGSAKTDPEAGGSFSYAAAGQDDKDKTGTLTYTFPKTIEKAYTVTFQTKVTDEKLFATNGEVKIKNTASLTSTEHPDPVTADGTATVKNTIVDKNGVYDSDVSKDTIDWQVGINSNQITLKNITLTDELPAGLKLDESTPVQLFLRTLSKDGSLTLGKQVTSPKVAVAASVDEHTKLQTVTFTIPGTISDAYLLTFSTKITDSTKKDFSNTIQFKGAGAYDTSGNTEINISSQDSGGSASGKTGSVTIYKVDENGNPLTGAKFQILYNGKVFRSADEAVVTDNKVVFNKLKFKRVYQIQEVSAPKGYQLDSTPLSFTLTAGTKETENASYNFINTKTKSPGHGGGGGGGGGWEPHEPEQVIPSSSIPPSSAPESSQVPTEPIGDEDVPIGGISSAPSGASGGTEKVGDNGTPKGGLGVKTGDDPVLPVVLSSLMAVSALLFFVVAYRKPKTKKKK